MVTKQRTRISKCVLSRPQTLACRRNNRYVCLPFPLDLEAHPIRLSQQSIHAVSLPGDDHLERKEPLDYFIEPARLQVLACYRSSSLIPIFQPVFRDREGLRRLESRSKIESHSKIQTDPKIAVFADLRRQARTWMAGSNLDHRRKIGDLQARTWMPG